MFGCFPKVWTRSGDLNSSKSNEILSCNPVTRLERPIGWRYNSDCFNMTKDILRLVVLFIVKSMHVTDHTIIKRSHKYGHLSTSTYIGLRKFVRRLMQSFGMKLAEIFWAKDQTSPTYNPLCVSGLAVRPNQVCPAGCKSLLTIRDMCKHMTGRASYVREIDEDVSYLYPYFVAIMRPMSNRIIG